MRETVVTLFFLAIKPLRKNVGLRDCWKSWRSGWLSGKLWPQVKEGYSRRFSLGTQVQVADEELVFHHIHKAGVSEKGCKAAVSTNLELMERSVNLPCLTPTFYKWWSLLNFTFQISGVFLMTNSNSEPNMARKRSPISGKKGMILPRWPQAFQPGPCTLLPNRFYVVRI